MCRFLICEIAGLRRDPVNASRLLSGIAESFLRSFTQSVGKFAQTVRGRRALEERNEVSTSCRLRFVPACRDRPRRSSSGKALLLFSSGSSRSRWPLIDIVIVCDSDSVDSSAGIAEFILRFPYGIAASVRRLRSAIGTHARVRWPRKPMAHQMIRQLSRHLAKARR